MKKKIFVLAALLVLAVCLLVGCRKDPAPTPPSEKEPALVLSAENIANYKFVRADESSSKDTVLFTKLADGINKATGHRPTVDSDFLYNNAAPAELEILIGETNRAESAEIYKDLKYNDFVVALVGTKVVVAGGSYESQSEAIDYFVSLFKDGKASFAENYRYEKNAEYKYSDIKIDGVSISNYQIVYSSAKNLTASNIIKDGIGKACGYRIPVVKQNAAKTDYEIAVGNTNRKTSEECDYYTYKISTSGGKFFIDSYDTYALNAGAHKIVELLTKTGDMTADSVAYDYKVPTNAEMVEDIDSLYMRWAETWQPPEGMLDYAAKKNAIVNVSDRLMTCAHRADSFYYPENSLPSIISFYKMGGDVVELDVMATKDNVLILMHDTTLNRMTNASEYIGKTINGITFPNTYNVTDWTYEQIQYLYLKEGWGDSNLKMFGTKAELTSFKVPTLTEVLKVCKNRLFILPDKAQINNGGQWRYADISSVQTSNRNVFLYTSMVEADNYESIILSYGYLSAYEAVTVQKWIYERTQVAPLIIVRKDNASGVIAEYEYLTKRAIPNTYAVHIGGAYDPSFADRYSSAYEELRGAVLIHGWTILYKDSSEGGGLDEVADGAGTWQEMYNLGYRMIMGNNYLKLVKFAAGIYENMN